MFLGIINLLFVNIMAIIDRKTLNLVMAYSLVSDKKYKTGALTDVDGDALVNE